ncbi:MAG: ATP-binding protein [Oligoflexus sp.]|nr:ATP-binding protein [Oligoflexus sp.]
MDTDDDFSFFDAIQRRLLAEPLKPLRLKAKEILAKDSRAALLIGPRGVGKTNILLEKVRLNLSKKLLYISADHPRLRAKSLLEFAESAFIYGYDGLLVDEVHYYKNWSQDLKALYDSHPQKIIWASDSSSGVLRDGGYDLSRRFIKIDVPLLSFREYIHLNSSKILDSFNPFQAESDVFAKVLATEGISILGLFQSYMAQGLRPMFLEGDYSAKIAAVIEKTIHSDIPYLVEDLRHTHLMVMSAIVRALVMNPIPTFNIDSMCKDWGIGRDKLYSLLSAMEAIGLIHIVKRKSDQSAFTKGSKIFMADPSVYSALGGNLGSRREALVYFCVKNAGLQIFASKDEEVADFEVDNLLIEVGGKSKKIKKADYIVRDDIDMPRKGVIPLWSFGMMN